MIEIKQRTSCAAFDCSARPCFAVIKAGKPKGACPPLRILGEGYCWIASHGAIDFRRGRKSPFMSFGSVSAPRQWSKLLSIRDRFRRKLTSIWRKFWSWPVCGLKPLQFLSFSFTILMLRKQVTPNKSSKHSHICKCFAHEIILNTLPYTWICRVGIRKSGYESPQALENTDFLIYRFPIWSHSPNPDLLSLKRKIGLFASSLKILVFCS